MRRYSIKQNRQQDDFFLIRKRGRWFPSWSCVDIILLLAYSSMIQYIISSLLVVACCAGNADFLIDCGSNVSYEDPDGYFPWTKDVGDYIQTGSIGKPQYLPHPDQPNRPLNTLRYFPLGKKNCYTVSGTAEKVIVRAGFYYGNYDNRSSPPTFDLLLDANHWATIDLFNSSDQQPVIEEAIYVTRGNNLSVCLGKSQPDSVPFISSLEIRSLPPQDYQQLDSNSFLRLHSRKAFGSGVAIRHHNENGTDSYDRVWLPFTTPRTVNALNCDNFSNGNTTSLLPNEPPGRVLCQAITPSNQSDTVLDVHLKSPDLAAEHKYYHLGFYFAEVVWNASNRSFNVCLNGDPAENWVIELPSLGSAKGFVAFNWSLSSDDKITLVTRPGPQNLPPLINAQEIYIVSDQLTNGTDASNVNTLNKILIQTYPQLQSWGDPCLPAQYKWNWINCSSQPTPLVTELHLSGYELSGPLTADFSALTALQMIDLNNNSLNGSIPEFLGHLHNLRDLNLADNHFTGSGPCSLTTKVPSLKLNVSGNNVTFCKVSEGCPLRKVTRLVLAIIVCAVTSVIVLLLLLCCKAALQRWKPVSKITNDFEKEIGNGGMAKVYHRKLQDGQEVAVKVMKDSVAPVARAYFDEELKLLMSSLRHEYLVRCFGCCIEEDWMILLYEYMAGGNLRAILSGDDSSKLAWEKRLGIALNVARGMNHLHSGCESPIVHRDVKTQNILLDGNLEAKLADFGLCKEGSNGRTMTFSPSLPVAGTPGYIDPEYLTENCLTRKSDVYSFGIVLFELITGKHPRRVDSDSSHITQWANAKMEVDDIDGIADPVFRGDFDVYSMREAAKLASQCTSTKSISRPTMKEVVQKLVCLIDIATARNLPSLSEVWGLTPTPIVR